MGCALLVLPTIHFNCRTPVPELLELGLLCLGDERTAAGLVDLCPVISAATIIGLLVLISLCGGVGKGGGDALSSSLGKTAS